MRISDWSSDVCSSDLQVVDLGADGHRVGEQGLVRGTMAEVGADRGEHRFAAGLEGVAQAGEIVHALARVGTIALPGGAQAVEGGAQFGGRSEEHTSELQSLMRTSYAVFCLKKKKKNTT